MRCADGTKVWLTSYYVASDEWSTDNDGYRRLDYAETITEAEYIIRKLTGN
jgi:hypothetical protein